MSNGKVKTEFLNELGGDRTLQIPLYLFVDVCQGRESIGGDSPKSRRNEKEAEVVVRIIKSLRKVFKDKEMPSSIPNSIGILTPYRSQQSLIRKLLGKLHDISVEDATEVDPSTFTEVATVDAFQGSERDYIIFSAVRAQSGSARRTI